MVRAQLKGWGLAMRASAMLCVAARPRPAPLIQSRNIDLIGISDGGSEKAGLSSQWGELPAELRIGIIRCAAQDHRPIIGQGDNLQSGGT